MLSAKFAMELNLLDAATREGVWAEVQGPFAGWVGGVCSAAEAVSLRMTARARGMWGLAVAVVAIAAAIAVYRLMDAPSASADSVDARQRQYEAVLARYRREFPRGTTRQTIRTTLQNENVAIEDPDMVIPASGQGDLLVKVGEGPATAWYCSAQWVYVDMRFTGSSDGLTLDPESPLERIELERQDKDCL
jgi:type II secretory pathway pseudopilin PulG